MIRSVNNLIFNKLLALGESKNLLIWNISILVLNYLFIAIIYLSGASIERFLLINIFISFSVLCFSFYKLLAYLENKEQVKEDLLKYFTFMVGNFLILSQIHSMEMSFYWKMGLSILVVLTISFIYYKEKMCKLLQFRII